MVCAAVLNASLSFRLVWHDTSRLSVSSDASGWVSVFLFFLGLTKAATGTVNVLGLSSFFDTLSPGISFPKKIKILTSSNILIWPFRRSSRMTCLTFEAFNFPWKSCQPKGEYRPNAHRFPCCVNRQLFCLASKKRYTRPHPCLSMPLPTLIGTFIMRLVHCGPRWCLIGKVHCRLPGFPASNSHLGTASK